MSSWARYRERRWSAGANLINIFYGNGGGETNLEHILRLRMRRRRHLELGQSTEVGRCDVNDSAVKLTDPQLVSEISAAR